MIRSIPDGEYFFADYTDEDLVGGYPCRIALNLIVKDDELLFDFSESDPQLNSSLNIPTGGDGRHALLMVGTIYVLGLLDRTLYLNSGALRPCRSILPKGSMVNPEFPAAVGMRTLTTLRLQSVIFGAFAQALPDRIPAACRRRRSATEPPHDRQRTGRKIMANLNPISGGGAEPRFATESRARAPTSASSRTHRSRSTRPRSRSRSLSYGLAKDSGGSGKFRGGLGTEMEFEVHAPHTFVTARNRDRSHFAPWGLKGGRAGKTSAFWLNRGSNREADLGNTDILTTEPGDRIYIKSAGAGGWGTPGSARPRAFSPTWGGASSPSRRRGGIRRDHPRWSHRCGGNGRAVKTWRRRIPRIFGFNAYRTGYEKVWTRGAYAEMIRIVGDLPVHWRFFVKR